MNKSVTGRYKYKLVFLGDQGTGKSSIIQRFIHDRFQLKSNPTIGIDFLAKNFIYNDCCYRLQLWDTAGQQRFKSLIPGYLKDAIGAIFVYDKKNSESLKNLQKWINLFKQNKSLNSIGIICGNKLDLIDIPQTVNQGLLFAKQHSLPYFQVSAKTGLFINDMFCGIIKEIIRMEKMKLSDSKSEIHMSKVNYNGHASLKQVILTVEKQNNQFNKKRKRSCCQI